MRLDRFITLMVHRLRRGGGSEGGKRLPVLMYHSIGDRPEPELAPYYRLWTSHFRFRRQMECLDDLGFVGVGLEKGLAWLRGPASDNRQHVAITFDDGFRSFESGAFPILARHGFSATVYLPTAFIAEARAQFKQVECMTWGEVRELHAAGIEFGSHTVHHPRLHGMGWDEIGRELSDSRREMEDRLQSPVTAFAYPFAFPQGDRPFVNRFISLLRDEGYRSSVTTRIGTVRPQDDWFQLCRLPVNSCDDDALFVAKLEGAYDWLGAPQRWSKRVRPKGEAKVGA